MTQRQTVVVHGRLAADQVRLEAARSRRQGVQIMSIASMAARLAGGFLRCVDGDTLSITVGTVLREVPPGALGDLEKFATCPDFRWLSPALWARRGELASIWTHGSWSTHASPRSPR